MSTRRRLGAPIELPWWVVPMAWPPAGVIIIAVLIASPVWARLTALTSSLAVMWLLVRIARRVESRSMQSVWVSTVYGLWVFFLLVWVAGMVQEHA